MNLKKWFILLLVLTVINVFFFAYRDKSQYIKYSTYQDLYSACNEDCSKKWRQFTSAYPASELKEARGLTTSLGIKDSSTLSKVLAIGRDLFIHLKQNPRGRPPDELMFSTPLFQYKKTAADTTANVWCGTYSQVFAYFCWSQNIVSRSIEIMNPGNHHSVVECYIPESKSWVLVDVTNNLLLVQDHQGNNLNAQSLRTALNNNSPLFSVSVFNDSVQRISLNKEQTAILKQDFFTNDLYNYYYYTDNTKAYSTFEKLKRYFLPVGWYEIYSEKEYVNYLFYLKLLFLMVWVVALFAFLIQLAVNDRNKRLKERV